MAIHSRKAKEIDVYIDGHRSKCVKGKQKVDIESGLYYSVHNIRKIYSYISKNWLNRLFDIKFQQLNSY